MLPITFRELRCTAPRPREGPYPPDHFSMPHLGSWLKPSFHQHGFNQQENEKKYRTPLIIYYGENP